MVGLSMNHRRQKPTTYTQTFYTVGLSGYRIHQVTFHLNNEMVPLGTTARTFQGYPSLFHALAVASTTTNIGLIYQAAFNAGINRSDNPSWFGKFFVFDTGMKPFPHSNGIRIWSEVLPDGIIDVRFTNLEERVDTRTWSERRAEVHSGAGKRSDEVYELAKQVIQDFTHLESTEINADFRLENKLLSKEDRKQQFLNGQMVNIFYSEPLSHTWTSPSPDEKFCEKSNTQSPTPILVLSHDEFLKPHPIYMLSTLAHEGIHVLHIHRAALLLEQWRLSTTRRGKDFHVWAYELSRRPNSPVTKFDYLTVLSLCRRMSGNRLVHLENHVEGWILKATYLPDTEVNLVGIQSPLIKDFIDIQMLYYVPHSQDLGTVQTYLEPRLVRTYNNLNQHRRQVIRESLRIWLNTADAKGNSAFMNWLLQIWSVKSN
jgi:hypothetical protein